MASSDNRYDAKQEARLLHAHCTTNYFIVSRDYARLFYGHQSFRMLMLFLQDLINLGGMRVCPDGSDAGWFLCTVAYLENSPMKWNANIQGRLLKILRERGYIEIGTGEGRSPQRYLRVAISKIGEDLAKLPNRRVKVKETQEDAPKRMDEHSPNVEYSNNDSTNIESTKIESMIGRQISNTEKKTKTLVRNNTLSARFANGSVNGPKHSSNNRLGGFIKEKESPPDQAETMANRLYIGVHKKNKIMRRPSLLQWRKEFAHLLQEAGPARVKKVLDWYLLHIGEDYVPEAFCAKTFKDKFIKIEGAMERSLRPVKVERNGHGRPPLHRPEVDQNGVVW